MTEIPSQGLLETVELRQAWALQQVREERLGVPINDSKGYGLSQPFEADARDRSTWPDLAAWLVKHQLAYVEALEGTLVVSGATQL